FDAVWVPGTDHAGIATQTVVRRQLEAQGIDYRAMGREAFLDRVWSWKAESSGTIRNQLDRLGASCDWSRERFTLDTDLQRAVMEHFVQLYEDGLIYRGRRLINWDPFDQTALSDLEVEHEEGVVGELYSFAYPIREEDGGGEIVVATTRPETMLGDTAIAVHPDDPRYEHLIGKTVRHPILSRDIPILADAILVDPAFGTGAVKVTPAHDFNDFAVGRRHSLPMINLLNLDGTMNENAGEFAGLAVSAARTAVKAKLEELGLFRESKPHTMAIGRSQRSGAVVEPMLSTQWFVKMKALATPALAAVRHGRTRFVPKQWENTYFSWLDDVQDWCISRQLWWGHRIPAWLCDRCEEVHVARQPPTVCKACGSDALTQDPDVLDTWFSSALWPFSVFGWPRQTEDLARYYPTTVLVTGFDIIFFWVARMMFAGIHLMGEVPFSDVYIHALVRDKNGEKMSKMKGNVVNPLDVIDRWGADSFRFTLVAFAAQGRDVLWDEKRVEANSKFTHKIWQALRFCFLAAEKLGDPEEAPEYGMYDRWIRARTGAAVARVRTALDDYRFNEAANEIHAFVWGEFCDWYLELSKAAIYGETPAARRAGVRATLFDTIGAIARLVHPIMPFFSEEIWHRIPGSVGLVAVAPYPRVEEFPADGAVLVEVATVQEAVTEIRRIRADMEIGFKPVLELRCADPALGALLLRHAAALEDLANATVVVNTERPAGVATAVVRGVELLIPLEGVVDFSAEVARLGKAIGKVQKDVGDLERRLASPGFVDKAKPEIVEDMREKLAAAKIRLDTLAAGRDRLAAALGS
ncbi:MAG: valine--tRNA ligase, partial [Deltaproteobacteria bacterium]|nr:valine--tRNA ligase [Deltaproteobacteria bacterium]